jgi:Uncharacterised protein family (UPF0158)
MATARIIIDSDSFIVALESHEAEIEWVLDLRTGKVIAIINPAITGDATAQEALEREPTRYFSIDPIPSSESFSIMETFATDLPPSAARDRLLAALVRRHPFREFKSAIHAFPPLRVQWFRYHDERMRSIAEEWLGEHAPNAKLRTIPTGGRGV